KDPTAENTNEVTNVADRVTANPTRQSGALIRIMDIVPSHTSSANTVKVTVRSTTNEDGRRKTNDSRALTARKVANEATTRTMAGANRLPNMSGRTVNDLVMSRGVALDGSHRRRRNTAPNASLPGAITTNAASTRNGWRNTATGIAVQKA